MAVSEVVTGQQRGWSLLEKLGEGDAGEVFLVESPLDKTRAILKRPHRSAFSADILRQAAQIETEGKILRALGGVYVNGQGLPAAVLSAGGSLPYRTPRMGAPAFLDGCPQANSFGEKYFIVIEKAPGFDLGFLARVARFGLPSEELEAWNYSERIFLSHLTHQGEVPDLILLRALASCLDLMEKIHSYRVTVDAQERGGILWNDVKPEHIFWDPFGGRFTLIDWGNGQFLEVDGTSKDRRSSRVDDYAQFMEEMGKFIATAGPDLHARLAWPEVDGPPSAYLELISEFKAKIGNLLQGELDGLLQVRSSEADIIGSDLPQPEMLAALDQVHSRLLGYGEFPDYVGAEHFMVKLGTRVVSEKGWADFQAIAGSAMKIPGSSREKWELLGQIASLPSVNGSPIPTLSNTLLAGLNDDWPEALWNLLLPFRFDVQPPWWEELSTKAREMQLGSRQATGAAATAILTPYVAANRLSHTLQSMYLKLCDSLNRQGSGAVAALAGVPVSGEAPLKEPDEDLRNFENLVKLLREEVLKKWQQVEPDPPNSGLEYRDIDSLMDAIAERLPEGALMLRNSLDQPKAQISLILDAWGRKDFETARRGLRLALFWDPDRRRVLTAEEAMLRAPGWLETVYLGPRRGDTIADYLTHVELEGRELRNQVGSAAWLDLILDALTKLRKGANPADLIFEHPELLTEMSWLNEYEQRRPAPVQRSGPVKLERSRSTTNSETLLRGVREGALGPDGEVSLGEPLDTWAPEARGSSARVFLGKLRGSDKVVREAAVKIMRPDRADYALPLFREEAQVLTLMRDVPGVNELYEFGFLSLENGDRLPEDDRQAAAAHLQGTAVRFGVSELREFLANLDARASQSWLPYVAVAKQPRQASLVMLCDAGYTHGRYLPLQEGLRLAIQILDVLSAAHLRNIVYRDHKILHYYWLEEINGVTVIDWNVAKRHPQGLTTAEKSFDLVQFGARALHHILTGRVAPGALPLGPTRPEEIERASRTYTVQWTYDDQRLPTVLREIVERALGGGYSSAKDLRDELQQVFIQLPDTSL